MAVLRINGYAVPARIGYSVEHQGIMSKRAYSPNGLYQLQRNALARKWRVTTRPLPKDEALALAWMLGHQGDGWVWDLSTAADGVHYIADGTEPEGWSDKRRVPQAAEAVATVMSAYGADGSRVYDWNGNAYAPFSGCTGSLLVEPGTTNLVTANQFHPTANGHLTDVTGGTHAPDPGRYWTGSSGIAVNAVATSDGVEISVTGVVSTAYVLSVLVKGHVGSEALRIRYRNGAGTVIAQDTPTLSSDTDRWQRLYLTGTQITDTTVRLQVLSNAGGMDFSVDGFQIEVDPGDGYPTAPVDPGSDPWGSGNGVRDNGVLDFDTFLAGYTQGITVSAWVNLQKPGAAVNQVIFDSSSTNPYCQMYVNNTDDAPRFAVVNSSLSALLASGSALSTGWNHMVGVYDAQAKTAYIYVNGALSASDTTWSGIGRAGWDAENHTGDLSIGSIGVAGSNNAPGPLGPISVLPFAAPANLIAGWYQSGTDDRPVPGVLPLAVDGEALGAGEKQVYCYAQVRGIQNVPFVDPDAAAWDAGAATVDFELFEATGRVG